MSIAEYDKNLAGGYVISSLLLFKILAPVILSFHRHNSVSQFFTTQNLSTYT